MYLPSHNIMVIVRHNFNCSVSLINFYPSPVQRMVKQWSCFGSCEPSAASRLLNSQRRCLVLLHLMEASYTWWALPISVIAAKRM